ncbi:MAG: plastocyanin/azurin family copper-binding protein [Candidatus Limnocylindrales bacterium]
MTDRSAAIRRPGRLALVGGLMLSIGIAGIAAAWAAGPDRGTVPQGAVVIGMRYSAFTRTDVTVVAGEPLTVVLENRDPIDHEWLVGDPAFHDRHRTGTDVHHGATPYEVSVPAGTTATTTVTFQLPGEYRFICHLPGHEAYGMVGVVWVVPAS